MNLGSGLTRYLNFNLTGCKWCLAFHADSRTPGEDPQGVRWLQVQRVSGRFGASCQQRRLVLDTTFPEREPAPVRDLYQRSNETFRHLRRRSLRQQYIVLLARPPRRVRFDHASVASHTSSDCEVPEILLKDPAQQTWWLGTISRRECENES